LSRCREKRQGIFVISASKRKWDGKKKNKEYEKLDKIPKNASPVRLKNRCKITGRGRGYIRKFGISRIIFRE